MRRILTLLLVVAATLALVFVDSGPVHADDVAKIAVIVHKDNSESLTKATVKSIFLRQKTTWTDGTVIEPCQMDSDTGEAKVMRQAVLSMSEKELEKHWANMRAKKGLDEPVSRKKSKLVFRFVKAKKGAIGYVDMKYLDAEDGWKDSVNKVAEFSK